MYFVFWQEAALTGPTIIIDGNVFTPHAFVFVCVTQSPWLQELYCKRTTNQDCYVD